MKKALITLLVLSLLCGTAMAQQQQQEYTRPNYNPNRMFTGAIYAGYYGGTGMYGTMSFLNFAEGFPFGMRLGIGYSWRPAGDALLARRVFIDNATNGTPKSKGSLWDVSFDMMYNVKLFKLERSKLYGGVRHSKYSGYFEYTGGNETFNVEGAAWGLGGGIETAFAISPIVDLSFMLGADYYFKGELYGHGSYYRPNGDDVDPTGSYTYKDADAAANQADVEPRFMIGLAYRF